MAFFPCNNNYSNYDKVLDNQLITDSSGRFITKYFTRTIESDECLILYLKWGSAGIYRTSIPQLFYPLSSSQIRFGIRYPVSADFYITNSYINLYWYDGSWAAWYCVAYVFKSEMIKKIYENICTY